MSEQRQPALPHASRIFLQNSSRLTEDAVRISSSHPKDDLTRKKRGAEAAARAASGSPPAPRTAAGAEPAAPAARLPPLRPAALSPWHPGRDGTGRGGGRRAALSPYDRPDRRDRALAHSQWHHPRWQHQCRRKQRPWLCVAQSESPSHGWKSGLPAQLRASA